MDQPSAPSTQARDASWMLWLGLPLLVLALVALSPLAGQGLWRKFMVGEKGLIENGTVVLLAPALVL